MAQAHWTDKWKTRDKWSMKTAALVCYQVDQTLTEEECLAAGALCFLDKCGAWHAVATVRGTLDTCRCTRCREARGE